MGLWSNLLHTWQTLCELLVGPRYTGSSSSVTTVNRRFFHRCALWLLPLIAVRALVPVGFMVSVGAQGLDLTFCPSQATALVRMLAAVHPAPSHGQDLHGNTHQVAGDAHAQHGSHHGGAQEIQIACPFAVASTATVADIPPLPAVVFGPADEFIAFQSLLYCGPGPLRTDRIRGPPALS
jgi:hypothetical protein